MSPILMLTASSLPPVFLKNSAGVVQSEKNVVFLLFWFGSVKFGSPRLGSKVAAYSDYT
jgi:hypothetical protein